MQKKKKKKSGQLFICYFETDHNQKINVYKD
jgi:hypothetical protein